MKYTVITTFNQVGLDLYGLNMVQSFDQYWPRNIALWVYTENCSMPSNDRVVIRDLLQCSPDLVAFKQQHANNPTANGLVAKDTGVPFHDNSFKWDAVKFSHKVFAVIHACANADTDWVIWLDADTKTFTEVPEDFLPTICNSQAMACYLGRRQKYHSECGWVAYNLRHPALADFMQDWRDLYCNGSIFCLKEYHDSFVFDHLRRLYQTKGVLFHNLSPTLQGKGPGHPFIASVLGQYMDHMKGTLRKTMGHSLPDDYERNQGLNSSVPYWSQIFGKR